MEIVVSAVAVGQDGDIYHSIRKLTGWRSDFHDLNLQSIPSAHFTDVSCGSIDAINLQVVGVGSDGMLWHTIRESGIWQASFGLVESQSGQGPAQFKAVGCCGGENAFYVVGLGTDGKLWQTTRDPGGGWSVSFSPLASVSQGGPNTFLDIDCASDDGRSVHFVGLGDDGQLWHTFRDAFSVWQSTFGFIAGQSSGGPPQFRAISCAGSEQIGGVEVVGVGNEMPGGKLWHTTRNQDGSWQSSFVLLGPASQTGEFVDVACGYDGVVLHVLAVKTDGTLWHISRQPQGWENLFVQIPQSQGVPAFIRIGCCWPDTLSSSMQSDPRTDHDWEGPDEDDDEEDEENDQEDEEEEDEDDGRIGKPIQPRPVKPVPSQPKPQPGPSK